MVDDLPVAVHHPDASVSGDSLFGATCSAIAAACPLFTGVVSFMKFSIRDILLVTLIVALAMGWWVDRSRLEKDNSQLRDHVAKRRLNALESEIRGPARVVIPGIDRDKNFEALLDKVDPTWRNAQTHAPKRPQD